MNLVLSQRFVNEAFGFVKLVGPVSAFVASGLSYD